MQRKSLSAIEVMHLVGEFSGLRDGKVDSIFQYSNIFYFNIHLPNVGKKIIKIILPGYIFLTETRIEKDMKQSGFSDVLRKHLLGSRIKKIEQYKGQRIIEIQFETKEKTLFLVVELFSQGNVVLCDEKHNIIGCLTSKRWSQREIRRGLGYVFPESIDPFKLAQKDFEEMISQSKKENIIKTLAIDLGLGGLYAEELCLRAGVEKELRSGTLDKEIVEVIYFALGKMVKAKPSSYLVYDDEGLVDFLPIKLEYYSGLKTQRKNTLSEAIEVFLRQEPRKISKKFGGEIERLGLIIKKQEKNLEKVQKEIEHNRKKGDLIYEKYGVVKEVLEGLKKARENHSWKEIGSKLKGHKLIKRIDEKDGKIVIDI